MKSRTFKIHGCTTTLELPDRLEIANSEHWELLQRYKKLSLEEFYFKIPMVCPDCGEYLFLDNINFDKERLYWVCPDTVESDIEDFCDNKCDYTDSEDCDNPYNKYCDELNVNTDRCGYKGVTNLDGQVIDD